MRASAPGVHFSDKYRTVPENRILDMLLLAGHAYEPNRPKALATTRNALTNWIHTGLGVQEGPTGERLFDPVEVVNTLKQLGLEGRDGFWTERYIQTGRRLVTDLADRGKQVFHVNFQRSFNLRAIPVGKTLRLRMPLPLSNVHTPNLIIIATYAEGAPDARLVRSEGRLEARLAANGGTVTLGAKIQFMAEAPNASSADPPDNSVYLKPREGLIVISERVRALTEALVGPAARPTSVVRAFWNYLIDEFRCGAIHYDQLRPEAPCDFALDSGWYDCQLGSALFIAMCRSRGIPARLVSGHVLYRRAPTNHYWAEAWLEDGGWTPFDFLSWDLSRGGTDAVWRDYFYGRVDNRMVTQVYPFAFTGAVGLTMPVDWHIIQIAKNNGVEIRLEALNGNLVYSDTVVTSK